MITTDDRLHAALTTASTSYWYPDHAGRLVADGVDLTRVVDANPDLLMWRDTDGDLYVLPTRAGELVLEALDAERRVDRGWRIGQLIAVAGAIVLVLTAIWLVGAVDLPDPAVAALSAGGLAIAGGLMVPMVVEAITRRARAVLDGEPST